jgi:hypothetical protein
METMKIFLDDIREAPDGWLRVYWPTEVIELLKSGGISHVSLDHDLGDDARGTGYDVLLRIEEIVANNDEFVLPSITIHTANLPARARMEAALDKIRDMYCTRVLSAFSKGTISRGEAIRLMGFE